MAMVGLVICGFGDFILELGQHPGHSEHLINAEVFAFFIAHGLFTFGIRKRVVDIYYYCGLQRQNANVLPISLFICLSLSLSFFPFCKDINMLGAGVGYVSMITVYCYYSLVLGDLEKQLYFKFCCK